MDERGLLPERIGQNSVLMVSHHQLALQFSRLSTRIQPGLRHTARDDTMPSHHQDAHTTNIHRQRRGASPP